jgi:hypothetical protein
MHNEPSRLVNNKQVIVLKDDRKWAARRGRVSVLGSLAIVGLGHDDQLTAGDNKAAGSLTPVNGNRSIVDQTRGPRAGAELCGKSDVKPQPFAIAI